ncbi:MAG TPA: hypothetical protein VIB08_03600 [Thermoanaerobaculia bacterium]
MSDDPLHLYLEDHLAGAESAIALLRRLRDEHSALPLGRFASEMLLQVEEDHRTLEDFARRVADGPHPVKNAVAKLAEKVSRPKLSHRTSGPIGVLESLEFLALGVWGKRALWRALKAAQGGDSGLGALNLDRLISRAETQHNRVEERRLEAARESLTRTPSASR